MYSRDLFGGADPLVRGRRPRRPAHTWQGADIVVPPAGRARPARTRGSAPPVPPVLQLWQKVCGIRLRVCATPGPFCTIMFPNEDANWVRSCRSAACPCPFGAAAAATKRTQGTHGKRKGRDRLGYTDR